MMIGMAFSAVAWIGKSKMESGLNRQLEVGVHMTIQAAVAHVFIRPEGRMTGCTITRQVGMSVDTAYRRRSPISVELARAEDRLTGCDRGDRYQHSGQGRGDDPSRRQTAKRTIHSATILFTRRTLA